MILRKPYGFLIKYFRLIHLIITGILVYLVAFSNNIYVFLNNCISNANNRYNALKYINNSIYIYVLIVIGLFFIIYWLFKYKDKPRNIYIVSIIGYFLFGIYIYILYRYFNVLVGTVIEQKVIRAYRDIFLIFLCYQYLIIIVMFVRGLGFNIKKFDFSKDAQELGLSDVDREEVEVDFNVDTNIIMRKVRKQKRELGYFFQEYRVFILGIMFIILIFVGYIGYNYYNKELRVYNQGDVIGSNKYIAIKNSYYSISNDKNYVIISFDINKGGLKERFDVNSLELVMNKVEYLPNKNICNNFSGLGICYKKQYITNNINSYIVVYQVDVLNKKKAYLVYNDGYDDEYRVKLNLENYE